MMLIIIFIIILIIIILNFKGYLLSWPALCRIITKWLPLTSGLYQSWRTPCVGKLGLCPNYSKWIEKQGRWSKKAVAAVHHLLLSFFTSPEHLELEAWGLSSLSASSQKWRPLSSSSRTEMILCPWLEHSKRNVFKKEDDLSKMMQRNMQPRWA